METYDLIVPFGLACACSQILRRAGLQLLSLPFDWITPQEGLLDRKDDLQRRAELVAHGFGDWLRAEDLEFRGPHANGMDKYFNRRTGFIYLHDFPGGEALDASLPAVRAKYERRITRLDTLLSQARRVLFVRLDRPDLGAYTETNAVRTTLEILRTRFPQARIDFLLLQSDPAVPFDRRRLEDLGDGFRRLVFDYRPTAPDADPKQPDFNGPVAALKELFSVRDYRTADEKTAFDRRRDPSRKSGLLRRIWKGLLRPRS